MNDTNQRIEEFKIRIQNERDFCEELFTWSTTRLLAFKFAYYVLSETIVKDITYDGEERSWYIMGRALGHLNKDETSPCIDFDVNHPLANEAIVLARRYLRI
jgi:hypothetical protein